MNISNEFLELLVEKRKSSRKSLETIAEVTKISVDKLEAIENGNLDYFAGPFYIKSFIKQYADYLGVEIPADLFNDSSDASKTETNKTVEEDDTKAKPASTGKAKNQADFFKIFILLFFSVLLILFIKSHDFCIFKSSKNIVTEQNEDIRPQLKQNRIYLKAELLEDTWIRITSDGNIIAEKIFKQNKIIIWEAANTLKIKVGNVNGLTLSYKRSEEADFVDVNIHEGNKGDINEIEFVNESSQQYYSN